MRYTKYTHMVSGISSISGLVNDKMFKGYGLTVGEFLSIVDATGITNLERIYNRYNSSDFNGQNDYLQEVSTDIQTLKSLNPSAAKSFTPKYDLLKIGTEMVLTDSTIHMNMAVQSGSHKRNYNASPFIHSALKDLLADSEHSDISTSGVDFGLIDMNPKATVWLWSKSLDRGGHISGGLLDLTPFLSSVSTSKNKNGSSFSISLSYVMGEVGVSGSRLYDSSMNYVDNSGKRRRNSSYFHNVISRNDIVFIRLSRMKNERVMVDNLGDNISESDLVGNVYDMIGRVDNVHDMNSGPSGSVSVNINGSDLAEFLKSDGSSIYQTRYVSGGSTSEEIELGSGIFRMFGKHTSEFQLQDNPIEDQLLFIIDYMTRTTICSNIFAQNPNARKRKLDIGSGSGSINMDVSGVWQIFNIGVDESVKNYTSFNNRLGNDYSDLWTQMQSVCREPMVEVFTDTYHDRFFIIARRPIFDRVSVNDAINSGDTPVIREFEIISDSLDYDKTVYSWYKMDARYLTEAFAEDMKWIIPAKYFQEYADIFGDKPLMAQNPYLTVDMSMQTNSSSKILGRDMMMAGLEDFRYVIETNSYLPFTRTGQITISGRRDIKRGIWVICESYDEIMYVDGVSHNQIHKNGSKWTTALMVTRSMKIKDIDRYFSLVDMPIGSVSNNNDFMSFVTDTMRNWNVNKENFEYFVKRKRYSGI